MAEGEMSKEIIVGEQTLEAAILGGAVLGGGGGGWLEEAGKIGRMALEKGFSKILSLEALPEDALLLTVSAVGAPSVGSDVLDSSDFVRAAELFLEKTGIKIAGLISSEIGALGIVNGWLQSAALRIPVIDAPCNGRAHPLGLMGSMGLNRKEGYISQQTAVGGRVENRNRVEAFFSGTLTETSKLVRESAIKAGGMVAVARNPVSASYLKENGAPGAMEMALGIGKKIIEDGGSGLDSENKIRNLLQLLGGAFMAKAEVEKLSLKIERGLDIGFVDLKEGKRKIALTFWNEYMTLDVEGQRIATFPDLIMTFDSKTAAPLISAQMREKTEVLIISVPARKLILGTGAKDPELLELVEKATGKEILKHVK